MRKLTISLAVLAACALGAGVYVASRAAGRGDAGAGQPNAALGASAQPATSTLSTPTSPSPSPADMAQPSTPLGATPTAIAPAAPSPAEQANALRQQINALGLTRELTGEHVVSYDGRSRKVLGSKETSNSQAKQTVLLVRDDVSGQIDYWQSALQFVLKPGNDYEAFIRERPALQRRFVNIEQAQVTVDAANIAREHSALSADPRVASVNFMPVAARPTAK